MNFGSPRLLVVDDREDESVKIVKALWAAGLAARVIIYDEKILARASRHKLCGVRVIFMDINLLGGPMGQEQMNFSVVQQTIQSLLHDDNGPYLLITWSSHDDYAVGLFSYLEERLPTCLKPAATARLDKADFQGRKRAGLKRAVEQRLASARFFTLLWMWESAVFESAAHVASLVSQLAQQIDGNRSDAVGTVLKALAAAEAGKHLDATNAPRSYNSVLNQILMDCTEARNPQKPRKVLMDGLLALPAGTKGALWKRRANRMINVDESNWMQAHTPGDVFHYPAHGVKSRKPLPNVEHHKFIVENFVDSDYAKKNPGQPAVADWRLILVEVTPPCDHAQAKQVWHRYVVGVELPEDTAKALPKKGDYLMRLPAVQFSGDDHARELVLNSRLAVSVSPGDLHLIGKPKYRLRTQLLGDVIGWLARQQSRVGHLSLM